MSVTSPLVVRTMADLHQRLGGIPLERILARPCPGTATEADVVRLNETENRLAELVDGVLVEKAIGFYESSHVRPRMHV